MPGPVSACVGDCFRTGKPPRHRTRHPGRLSLYWMWLMAIVREDWLITKDTRLYSLQVESTLEVVILFIISLRSLYVHLLISYELPRTRLKFGARYFAFGTAFHHQFKN